MQNLVKFRELVTSYIKGLKGSSRNYMTQREFAPKIPLSEEEFSRRLNGKEVLTCDDIHRILKALAELKGITSQTQAKELLNLMDCENFSAAEWATKPLAKLDIIKESKSDESTGTIQKANVFPQNNLLSVSVPGFNFGYAPPPPKQFFGREMDLNLLVLKTTKNNESGALNQGPIRVLTAMRGWPGVGKTTLSIALANDYRIINYFEDGVLWVSLGKKPDLLSKLSGWARRLKDSEFILHSTSTVEASARLTELLRNKKALLVIDDVWEPSHASFFTVGGSKCVTLVTTRHTEIAEDLVSDSENLIYLDVLKPDEALMLIKSLAPTVVRDYRKEVEELLETIDYLPLAIQVAGRLLQRENRYKSDIHSLLLELRTGAEILKQQPPDDYISEGEIPVTVMALLQKSTDILPEQIKLAFALLGFLFEHKPAYITLTHINETWKRYFGENFDVQTTLHLLIDSGLLEPFETNSYQIHALLALHARILANTLMED